MGTVFSHQRDRTHRSETMSLDTYTQNIPLTQKARFWSNYVAALKGSQDLRAPDEAALRTWHPSIIETLPSEYPDLKHEFGKLESQMFDRPRRRGADPLSPVLPDARDRIFSLGYNYCPVHTEIYGTYRARYFNSSGTTILVKHDVMTVHIFFAILMTMLIQKKNAKPN